MRHPEWLLLPVFMLADYYLTLAGVVLMEKEYRKHFKTEHYELNPVWQKEVPRKKWFNPRHLALTLLVPAYMIALSELGSLPDAFIRGLFGCLISVYAVVLGRHLSNLLTFHHAIRRPQEMSGAVTMSHSLQLSISLYQLLVVLVPLALLSAFTTEPLVRGALAGVLLMCASHGLWLGRHGRRTRAAGNAGGAAPGPEAPAATGNRPAGGSPVR